MSDIAAIKTATNTAITNETAINGITPAEVGGRLNAITDELRPYKVYTALMNLTPPDTPTPTVLENTIGNIVWSYESTGIYNGTLAGAFDETKTFFMSTNTEFIIEFFVSSVDTITIHIYDFDLNLIDTGVANHSIEIRVYP